MKPQGNTKLQKSSIDRETALKVLTNLQNEYGGQSSTFFGENEAKTRLLIIDKILEALGWDKKDFNPEHAVKNVGFTDYLMIADDIPRFIVEAKKIGQTFVRPTMGLKKTTYKLGYVRTSFGPSVSEVINQAEGYAKETGVPYSVITNGAEWMVMQVIPNHNKGINDLQCFYLGNLLSNSSNFDLFWDLLAKSCVLNNSLQEHFSELNSLCSEFCLIPNSQLPEISWNNSNNASERYIRDFYDRFFGEIIDQGRRTMLTQCFVTNPKLDQYQGDLKRTLQDKPPSYIQDATDITPDYNSPAFLTKSGDKKGRVVLITGSVGCGKSTFINKVLFEQNQKTKKDTKDIKNLNHLIIDLINEFDDDPESINENLWRIINAKWQDLCPDAYKYETLRKIFHRELEILRNGAFAKVFSQNQQFLETKEAELLAKEVETPHSFLEKSWRYYTAESKKGIVVFLDNIDRTSDRYQRSVYTFAHKLASTTGATVIITMREGTYFRGQASGFLDVRSDDIVYHLQTPDLVQILSKRVDYIENIEKTKDPDKKDHRLSAWRSQSDWEKFYQACLKYTQVIKKTFLTSRTDNQSLYLLSAISWHNVRYFLDILRKLHLILGSEVEFWSISYMISALLSPNISENKPILPNIYYPVFPSYPCYFLKLRLLLRLIHGKHESELRRGKTLKKILNFTRMYSYHERWTRLAIKEMVRERLLECMEIPSEADFTKDYELDELHSFRASPLAIVMLNQIYFNSVYLAMIGRELPFHKVHAFEKFINAVRDVITIVSEESLSEVGIELLSETKADMIVAHYLVETSEEEKPIGDVLMQFPEVAATEGKLKNIISQLLKVAGTAMPIRSSDSNKDQEPSIFQPSLFQDFEKTELLQETSNIKVPKEFNDIQTAPKGLTPKIFWALVQLKARGQNQVTGSEIAHIINQYLTDDINRVEPTNISKALRSPNLQSQSWLKTEYPTPRKKLYGLANNWRSYWEQIFKEASPTFD